MIPNSLSLPSAIHQELSPLEHFFHRLSLNKTFDDLYNIILLQYSSFEKTLYEISEKYNVPLNSLMEEKKPISINPYLDIPLESLQFQIKGQYPFIFCDDWNQKKCAKFLWSCEEKEEYELHPLFFKYRSYPLKKLQKIIGNNHPKNKKLMIKNIVENSSVVFTDESQLQQEYNKLSEKKLIEILKKNFPGFPVPPNRENIILILSSF